MKELLAALENFEIVTGQSSACLEAQLVETIEKSLDEYLRFSALPVDTQDRLMNRFQPGDEVYIG